MNYKRYASCANCRIATKLWERKKTVLKQALKIHISAAVLTLKLV